MSNMSYCRMENTSRDFEDVLEAVQELCDNNGYDSYGQVLSDREFSALKRLVELSEEFLSIAPETIELLQEIRDENNK